MLASRYSSTGRPFIDPELMMRMLLVGYLCGIRSERRLCEEGHVNLADRVPDHSTSKNRHGRLRQCDLHRRLFEEVVTQCAAAGLVAGTDLAVDGSTVQADAGPLKRFPGATAASELRARDALARPVREDLAGLDAALPPDPDEPEPGPEPIEPKHVSPTDQQAAFTLKGGTGLYA